MKLTDIEKAQYRQRLNRIIIGFIAGFMVLAIGLGSIFIAIFSDGQGSNFKFNLFGVVLALFAMMAILHSLRSKPYFAEVSLVFKVKQELNKIYRKLAKIKVAAKQGDVNALIVLDYYYQSYKVIYQLDDNTLTMSSVDRDHQQVLAWATEFNLELSSTDYSADLVNEF